MQLTTRTAPGSVTVTVRGELDLHSARLLVTTLAELLPTNSSIALDIAQVDFIDSAALARLQAFQREASASAVTVTIAADSPAFRRILGLTGVGPWTRSATALPPA